MVIETRKVVRTAQSLLNYPCLLLQPGVLSTSSRLSSVPASIREHSHDQLLVKVQIVADVQIHIVDADSDIAPGPSIPCKPGSEHLENRNACRRLLGRTADPPGPWCLSRKISSSVADQFRRWTGDTFVLLPRA